MKRILAFTLPALAALAMMTTGSTLSAQSAKGAGPRACSLLTKELVLQVTPETNKAALEELLRTKPEEHLNGSLCDYAGVTLSLNPFDPKSFEKNIGKDASWVRVAGLGDAAWFHDVKGFMGELFVRSGPRTLGVVLEIPQGRTAESIKPNAVALAKAVLSRSW